MFDEIRDLVDAANGRPESKLFQRQPTEMVNSIQAVAMAIVIWLKSRRKLNRDYPLRWRSGQNSQVDLFKRVFDACPSLYRVFEISEEALDLAPSTTQEQQEKLDELISQYQPEVEEKLEL